MSAELHPVLTPNRDDMRSHIEHVFGGYLEGYHNGRIELAWTENRPGADGRYKLSHGETFDVEEIDELVARAVEVNSVPRTNVYIGAALRKPDTAKNGRCNDDDFYVATSYWSDLDDKDANDQARRRFVEAIPSFVVSTGTEPHWRHQLWWRLFEPIMDPERVRAAISGIATVLGGDGTVSNPSRVMRLAGTIAWDQKPGRRPELTRIVTLKKPGLRAYMPDHVERVYPPLYSLAHVRKAKSGGPNLGIVREKDRLGLNTGKVIDGRERHMINVICARLIDYCGQFGAVPTADELFEDAWPIYEASTDLSRAGRNKPEFMEKCRTTMRRFEKGKIRGARTLEEAVESYQTRRDAKRENTRHEAEKNGDEAEFGKADDSVFEFLDIPAIKALPDPRWIVKDVIIEDALGFIYGPPGHGKTFVSLSLALHIAYGLGAWWWGKPIQRKGLVIYVAREGVGGLKGRIEAWQRQHGFTDDRAPFALVRAGINFMDDHDVLKLLRTIEAAAAQLGAEPAVVFVDTVSRVLPGADENLQKEMTLFVNACDTLRDRFKATVVGVHHAGKSGDMRGSTVLKGAGDFVFKVEKDEGAGVRFTAEKIKDGEDGWSRGVELKTIEWVAEGVVDGARKSLVAVPADAPTPSQTSEKRSSWPDKATCQRVLAAIQAAWNSGYPWSNFSQAKKVGRYGPACIASGGFNISAKLAEEMIDEWVLPSSPTRDQVLAVETVSSKTKLRGLKVVGTIS